MPGYNDRLTSVFRLSVKVITMRHVFAVIISLSWLVAPMPSAAEAKGSYFAIVVTDIQTSLAWYESVLGLEVSARVSESGRYEIVNLRGAGLFIELIKLEAATDRPDNVINGPFKVGMLVSDLNEFTAQLPDSIAEPEVISDTRNELLLIQLRDPDDNTIQVVELLNSSAN